MTSSFPRIFCWTVLDCKQPSFPRLSQVHIGLPGNSDIADQVWVWENEDGSTFYFDIGEIVRFRVEMEEWHDQIPNAPDLGDGATTERKPPYSIIVCALAF